MIPPLDLVSLRSAYASGDWTPTALVKALHSAIEEAEPSAIWISRFSVEQLLERANAVEAGGMESQPLYGIPFAIKDNIDVAGLPTTAACPDFAFEPESSAYVVERLLAAGAIPIGKTNLDQFATGLVGVRSPYGTPDNAYHPDYIPGGSSSGSAIAVARQFVSFALGTDTAGSGRIPAAFNNLVGHKPTRGILSCRGVFPACKSLDCVSIFSSRAIDAGKILEVTASFDEEDAYARPRSVSKLTVAQFRFGIPHPEQFEFFGDAECERLFKASVERFRAIGGEVVEIDFEPFIDAAKLLYEGPWIAERFVAIEEVLQTRPEILHPVTRKIIEGGSQPSAVDAFKSEYRLRDLKRLADRAISAVDFILTPTAGTIYTKAKVEASPVQLNSNLGYYTNFMNLLDFAATAIPAGFRPDGLPLGVTLFAPAHTDASLLDLSARFLGEIESGWTTLVVCGAHMDGLALNHQLTSRGARRLRATHTAPAYRFYALPATGKLPPRPGLIRTSEPAASIAVEVWTLPIAAFGDFVQQIPPPLGIGKVELADGSFHPGFLCESHALADATEITELADWRSFLASL